MDKKIYCFFYYYPPLNSSEGISAYKIFNFIDLNVKIFSQKDNNNWCYSSDDLKLKNNVIYYGSHNWFDDVFNATKDDEIDITITRSMPIESHKIGLKLKKINKNMKWIVFISDPFPFNSPIYKYEFWDELKKSLCCHKYFSYAKKLLWYIIEIKIKNRLFWNSIKKKSDLIVCNNIYQKEIINSNKCVVIPHSYIEQKKSKNKKKNKIIFSYIGNITRCRNLDNYLLVINKLNEDPIISKKIQFNFVGVNDKELSILRKNENIKIINSVGFDESIKIMNESSFLINVDANVKKYTKKYIYLPCKLFDYISSSNPIINITDFEFSPTIDLVNEYGGFNVKNDKDDIYNCIIEAINNDGNFRTSKDINKYNSKYISEQIKAIINNIWKS